MADNEVERVEHSTHSPQHSDLETENMDVRIDGISSDDGRKGRNTISVGMLVLIQSVIGLVSFGGTYATTKADVDRLKVEAAQTAQTNQLVLNKLTEMEAGVTYLRDEIRYYREKMDKLQERDRDRRAADGR